MAKILLLDGENVKDRGEKVKMKLWHGILLGVGLLMVVGGLLAVVLPIDNPKYAPGEASAMVERVYHLSSSDLYEEYLGQGIWEVKSLGIYEVYPLPEAAEPAPSKFPTKEEYIRGRPPVAPKVEPERGQAIFRVYETTNTVQPYNNVARLLVKD